MMRCTAGKQLTEAVAVPAARASQRPSNDPWTGVSCSIVCPTFVPLPSGLDVIRCSIPPLEFSSIGLHTLPQGRVS